MSTYDFNSSLRLMGKRLGTIDALSDGPQADTRYENQTEVSGLDTLETNLNVNGGIYQQSRMIFDQRRTLERALVHSYQAAFVKKIDGTEVVKALINPNKNKVDYDDKIIAIPFESGYAIGDTFEWVNTNTYWLIYLQDLTMSAYFRGNIRRCSYQISWEDSDGEHSSYVSIVGPEETAIENISKHDTSIDVPNYSLDIMMPLTESSLNYFKRYAKFYLKDSNGIVNKICWRVNVVDSISTPNILQIHATEYYSNEIEDDLESGLVKKQLATSTSDGTSLTTSITGESYIKPYKTYTYKYEGYKVISTTTWKLDSNDYPIEMKVDKNDSTIVTIKWKSNLSGDFVLSYGDYIKRIIVKSLFDTSE